MKNYRKTSHSVYDLKYHLVWITKYRKPVFFGDVAHAVARPDSGNMQVHGY